MANRTVCGYYAGDDKDGKPIRCKLFLDPKGRCARHGQRDIRK